MENIHKNIKIKDYQKVKFDLHTIKGSSRQIGCRCLADLFEEMENDIENGNMENLTNMIEKVDICVVDTKKYICDEYRMY